MLIEHPTGALRICYDLPTKGIRNTLLCNGTITTFMIMLRCGGYFLQPERDLH